MQSHSSFQTLSRLLQIFLVATVMQSSLAHAENLPNTPILPVDDGTTDFSIDEGDTSPATMTIDDIIKSESKYLYPDRVQTSDDIAAAAAASDERQKNINDEKTGAKSTAPKLTLKQRIIHSLGEGISKAKVSGSAGSNNTINIGHNFFLGINSSIKISAEPAYIADYQQRLDQWTFALNPGIYISKALSLNASAMVQAQFTFARLLKPNDPTQNDKMNALFHHSIRKPWQFPTTAAEVVDNQHIGEGEMARLDLSFGVGPGVNNTWMAIKKFLDFNVDMSATHGSELIVDVYRMNPQFTDETKTKDDLVRLRVSALRRQEDNTGNIGFDLLKLFFKSKTWLVERLTGRFLSLDIGSCESSGDFIHGLPVETYSADYVFNLSTEEGRQAYNQIFKTLTTMRFWENLNFLTSDSHLAANLLSYVAPAEALNANPIYVKMAQQIEADPNHDTSALHARPVDRIFKGSMTTNYSKYVCGPNIRAGITLLEWKAGAYHTNSQIRGSDYSEMTDYLIYETSGHTNKKLAFNALTEVEVDRSVETLFRANKHIRDSNGQLQSVKDENGYPIPDQDKRGSLIANTWNELVFNRSVADKALMPSNIAVEKNYLYQTSPAVAAMIDWGTFSAPTSKTDSYITTKVAIHGTAFEVMKRLSVEELVDLISKKVDADPEVGSVPVSKPATTKSPNGSIEIGVRNSMPSSRLAEDIQALAEAINKALDPATPMPEVRKIFGQLRDQPLFAQEGAGILISLLPAEELAKNISISMDAGGKNQTVAPFYFGGKDVSPSYGTYQFMANLLTTRSFDMRVILDETAHFKVLSGARTNMICENCDAIYIAPTPAPAAAPVTLPRAADTAN